MLHNWRETDRISEHQYTSMSEKIASYSNEPNNWEYQNTTMIEKKKKGEIETYFSLSSINSTSFDKI